MKQLTITLALIIMSAVGFVSEVSAQSEECTMAAGPGGLKVFPWFTDNKAVAYMGIDEFVSVFFGKECGMKTPPKVTVPKGSGITCAPPQREGHRSGDVYTGYRVICVAKDTSQIGKSFLLEMDTEEGDFELTAFVVRSSRMVSTVTGKGLSAEQIRKYEQLAKNTDRALKRSDRALRKSRNALDVARSREAKLPMIGAKLGMLFNPAVSFRHGVRPYKDNPSGGLNMSLYWFFWKGGWRDSAQFGIMLDASWFRNKLEIEGLPPNPDLPSDQWDVFFNLTFRFMPCDWFSGSFFIGGGPSWVGHSDTVVVQEQVAPYRIAGVKDNANVHATLAVGGSLNFHIKRFVFGLTLKYTYGSDEIVIPSVLQSEGEHGNPQYLQLIVNAGFEL